MPINFGMQFVAPGKTQRAAEFLRGVCGVYDFSRTFVAGQEAIAEFMGVMNRRDVVERLRGEARREGGGSDGRGGGSGGLAFAKTPCGRFDVAFCL